MAGPPYIYIYIYIYIYPPPCPCGTKWSVLRRQTGSWIGETGLLGIRETGPLGTGKLGKQDPKGTSREPPPMLLFPHTAAWIFFCHFFDIVLRPQFSRFWCQLGPNLGPTWRQNRPKIDPRGLQISTQIASWFRCPFGSIFDRFWMPFWCQVGPS